MFDSNDVIPDIVTYLSIQAIFYNFSLEQIVIS